MKSKKTKTTRKIIEIDEELCTGCGLGVPSCAEGALQIVGAFVLVALLAISREFVNAGSPPDSCFQPVGAALLWTLEKGLGDAYTPEVNEAWTEAYMMLAGVMVDAMADA